MHFLILLSLFTFFALSSCSSADPSSSPTLPAPLQDAITITNLQAASSIAASVTINNAIDQYTGKLKKIIVLDGFVNTCTSPPCLNAETDIGVLTITNDSSAFIITDFGAFSNEITTATLPIPDQAGAASLSDVLLGSITLFLTADHEEISYEVIVHYSGTPTSTLIASLGGILNVLPANELIVSFANQFYTVAWNNNTFNISGMVNLPGNTMLGSISAPASKLLPSGYYIMPYTFTDPDGTTITTLSNTLNIAEGDEATLSVTAQNQSSYNVNIHLDQAPAVVISAEDLVITATMPITAAVIAIDSKHLTIDLNSHNIIITSAADIRNFNQNVHTAIGPWSLKLTNTQNANFMLNTTQTFDDPSGTEVINSHLESFSATNTATQAELSYRLIIEFAKSYNLMLGDAIFTDIQTSTTTSYIILPCDKPLVSIFTIAADDSSNIIEDASININYYYDKITLANNTNALTADMADGSSINFWRPIIIQECNTFSGGNGSETTPWIIVNDLQLERLSRLVNSDSANIYNNNYYSLSANVDMGDPNAPWSTGTGFVPIGKTTNAASSAIVDQTERFNGVFNCASHTIANLVISNTANTQAEAYGGSYIGLFGIVDTGGVITNCVLENATLTGYQYVGGLAGYQHNGTIANNVLSGASITAHHHYAGGLVGYQHNGSISRNAISSTSITANNHYTGGLAAVLGAGGSSIVEHNFIAATVNAAAFAGGLAGILYTTIENSYFIGNIVISNASTASGGIAAGISAELNNVYTRATITTASEATIFGLAPSQTKLTASYWDHNSNNNATGAVNYNNAPSAQNSDALQSPTAVGLNSDEVYDGWKEDDWDFGTSDQYPALKNLPLTAAEQRNAGTTHPALP